MQHALTNLVLIMRLSRKYLTLIYVVMTLFMKVLITFQLSFTFDLQM